MRHKKVGIEREDPFLAPMQKCVQVLNKYTILLLRPHDIGDDYGDCLLFKTEAETAAIALDHARWEAAAADEYEDSDDYKVLFCARGWHYNLACQGELLPEELEEVKA